MISSGDGIIRGIGILKVSKKSSSKFDFSESKKSGLKITSYKFHESNRKGSYFTHEFFCHMPIHFSIRRDYPKNIRLKNLRNILCSYQRTHAHGRKKCERPKVRNSVEFRHSL